MELLAGRRRAIAALTAAAVIGGGTWALAANPAPESYAFVARGDNPVDALAAAPLAGKLNAPVILTEPTVLTDAARRSLRNAAPDVVWIAGGTGAISLEVEAAIRSLLPDAEVERASGETRYHTSEELARQVSRLAPSFLMRDGKANAAEVADTANNAKKFGGLAPDEYQFTKVDRQGEVETFTFTGPDDTVDVLAPMKVTAPVDGVLHVDALADGGMDVVLALVDYEGEVDLSTEESTAEVYDHLAAVVGPGGGFLRIPIRVDAGEHTVRLVALASDTTAEVGLRSLSVQFTAGVTGTWEAFDLSSGAAATQGLLGARD